ncbi:class II lanthipeptide, LchA2/BrtA2 family [Amycolatopsis minnesotensis]|uniref:Lantibiotic n=1 Tax=Amycolatopsis minnesotensis TaxID=337894 RepID=A0ABN2QQT1_9PSEU
MPEKNDDILGRYDELELVELGDTDAHGGSWTVTIPISVAASIAFCPTTKCTSKC